MEKRLTHEEFVSRVIKLHPNIIVNSEYSGTQKKVECECTLDGNKWSPYADNLLRGHGCPVCSNNKKYTKESFIEKLSSINDNILVLGEYINSSTKIKCKCKKDGYEWFGWPSTLLKGVGCPRCSGKEHYTNEEFIKKVNSINSDIDVMSEYINKKTKVLCKCKKCNYEWESFPGSILKGIKCPKCINHIHYTTDEFIKELRDKNLNNIRVLGEYVNSNTKILCVCENGHEWNADPSHLLEGIGCPFCMKSKGEILISKYLNSHNIAFIEQFRFKDCINKKQLPFDFYLTDYNACIEYDGEQHFTPIERFGGEEEFKRVQLRDSIKTNFCKENNIKLLRIKYNENIEDVLDNFFKSLTILK